MKSWMQDHSNVSRGHLVWRFLGKGKGPLASSLNVPQASKGKRSLALPTGRWCLSNQFFAENWPVLSDQPDQASGESSTRLIRGARDLWLASVTQDKQQAQKWEVLGLPESPRFKSQPADSGSCSTKPETSTDRRTRHWAERRSGNSWPCPAAWPQACTQGQVLPTSHQVSSCEVQQALPPEECEPQEVNVTGT